MKKTTALLLAILMCLSLFVACGEKTDGDTKNTGASTTAPVGTQTKGDTTDSAPDTDKVAEPADMRVFAMNGPTGMGLVKIKDDQENSKAANNYTFTFASNADEITAEIIKGEYEIAAIPTNLASVLYHKIGGGFHIGAVNTLGVLYILENGDSVKSIADLEGKKIAATGQGSVPEYVLSYILTKSGVNCDIEFYADGAEVAEKLGTGDITLAMLPVPYATKAASAENVNIALSVTDEFKKASGKTEDTLCQACIIVRDDFAKENPEAVAKFMEEYEKSVDFVLNNSEEAAQLMAKYSIIPAAPVALAAIPKANLVFLTGDEMKDALKTFYNVLFEANPKSIGGSMPDEAIYG